MAEYLIQRETLSNIAEAIREKTGVTAVMLPGTMPGYIRNIQTGSSDFSDVPADIAAEAERVASGINVKKAANAITFIAMSDMHELGKNDLDMTNATNVNTFERNCRGNRNAGQAAKLISDKVALDFFANLGDLAFAAKAITTTEDGLECMRRALLYTADVMLANENFVTPGNHDTLTYSQSVNGGFLSPGVMDGLVGTYRYKDFDGKKVRVICLNTADNGGSSAATYGSDTGSERMSGEQLQWFANALDLSDKSNASEWGIIILSHHPLDWNNVKVAGNCLAAYLEGTAYAVTHNGVAVSKNFSGKNAAKVIAAFHGHTHCLKVDYINDFRSGSAVPTTVRRLAIPNAYFNRNNEYGTTSTYGVVWGESTTYNKSDNGTGKNTAFCVISIDLDEKIIYADCFGAGYDRVVSYGEEEIVTYSITTNLSHAEISNGASTILEGKPFSAVIAAYNGYDIDTVTVTMGGMDITSTAYSNGNISIASVTGDLVITVTTTGNVVYNVTNLVPTSEAQDSTAPYNGVGYQNGVYCSSEGGNGSDAAFVSTGYIPYEWKAGNVLYIRGAAVTSASHIRIYGYTGKSDIPTNSSTCSGTTLSSHFNVEELEAGAYYKLTHLKSVDAVTHIRLSLEGTGENLIVTVNEPIVADSGDAALVYSVTNHLINAHNSNGINSIAAGGEYLGAIIADPGYELVSITVTMGGELLTSAVYSGSKIQILNVTGDIVITAEAVASGGYVNLVPTAVADENGGIYGDDLNGDGTPDGYRNGKYLSSGSVNGFNNDAACVSTGSMLLPAQANAIYVKGAAWDTENGHARFASGATVGGISYVIYADGNGSNQLEYFFTLETLGTDYYKFTLTNEGKIYLRGKYFRFSLVGTGENLIVTVDEPIE